MNTIVVKSDLLESNVKNNIKIKSSIDLVKKYEIFINSSCDLYVTFDLESKLIIKYVIENAEVNIYEFRTSSKSKIEYQYDLNENASLYLYRINKCQKLSESDFINLNGVNSKIEFNLNSLATDEVYNIIVNHNNKNTESFINNLGIVLKGNLSFNVTGNIIKGASGSILDQNNRIITTTESEKCKINPNLLVDEYDVVANHNAIIGSFDEDILFYLMSRGINKNESSKLILEGLLLNKMKDEQFKDKIKEYLEEYWGVKNV